MTIQMQTFFVGLCNNGIVVEAHQITATTAQEAGSKAREMLAITHAHDRIIIFPVEPMKAD